MTLQEAFTVLQGAADTNDYPAANCKEITPHDIGRMALEASDWEFTRARAALLGMLARSPSVARRLAPWAFELAFGVVLRQLILSRSPAKRAGSSREVVGAASRLMSPSPPVPPPDHASAQREKSRAGEAAMARREKLLNDNTDLRKMGVRDWWSDHRLYGQRVRLGEATREQLLGSVERRMRQAAGISRNADFERMLAEKVTKGKKVKDCLTNKQIEMVWRLVR